MTFPPNSNTLSPPAPPSALFLWSENRFFFERLYENLRSYWQLRREENYLEAFIRFYELVREIRTDQKEKKRIDIPVEGWERLQQLYRGNIAKEYWRTTGETNPYPTLALSFWDTRIVERLVQYNEVVAYTRSGGMQVLPLEVWNELWLFLIAEADKVIERVEGIITLAIENELSRQGQDPDDAPY